MIDVVGLTKTYGAFTAVNDFSFHAGAGEIVGLIGPNGAGKTSTLRAIAGIHAPTAGAITIDGHNIVTDSVAAKQRLAFIADEPQLFEYLTVTEHLRLVSRIYQVADMAPRAATLLAELELSGKEHALPGELSRGMKQKVAIACGLIHEPKALLLDEPLTGLDPLGIRKMKETIVARGRAGAAIVVSSHLLHLVGRRNGLATVAAGGCFIFLAITVLIGPLLARNDLRRDLGNLAVLKAWPISGATLLRGEILAPAVLLGSIAWLLIVGATSLVGHLRVDGGATLMLHRLSYMTAALMVAPALILTELTVVNGLAVLFPAWIATGSMRARGVDALGQRLFTTAGILITLVVALVPAVLAASVVAGGVFLASGIVLVVVPAAIVAAMLVAECVIVIQLLGRVLDRTDVSAVSPAE